MKLIVIAWSGAILGSVEEANQDELKIQEKRGLYFYVFDYDWFAERCCVSDVTVRNRMARKPIHLAKEHIIRELTKQLPMNPLVQSSAVDDGMMTLKLDASTRKDLEEKAFFQRKSLKEFLEDEVPKLAPPER